MKPGTKRRMGNRAGKDGGGTAPARKLVHNLPYILTIALGGWLTLHSVGYGTWGFIFLSSYLFYSVVATLCFIYFLCGYCGSFGPGRCPSGFGFIASKLRRRGRGGSFGKRFRMHMPVVIPIWVIPVVIALYCLLMDFSVPVILILTVFVFNSFLVLPILSRKKGCSGCSQRNDCPWMKKEI